MHHDDHQHEIKEPGPMPFRLADIKKTVRSRSDGERYFHPKLLDAEALEGQVGLALAYFQSRLGRARRDFEPEVLVRFFGEPKVARGLVACLSTTYRWRTQSFADVLDAADLMRLGVQGIPGPSDLRLHLFDRVNHDANGFLAGQRGPALQSLAGGLGISTAKIDRLFRLDAEENAILVRVGDAPDPSQIIAQYNFLVVHAIIRNGDFLDIESAGAMRNVLVDACRAYGVSCSDQGSVLRVHNSADAFGSFSRWGQRVARVLFTAASVSPSLLKTGRTMVHAGGKPAWYLFNRLTDSRPHGQDRRHSVCRAPAGAG